MRSSFSMAAAFGLVLAACGQPTPSTSDAQTQTPTAQNAAGATLTTEERAAILNSIRAAPDARGQVTNACNDKVIPQFIAVELGGDIGTAHLAIIPGGPSSFTCYGDGPGDMHVMRRTGASFSEIHTQQGAFLAVLTSTHNGVRDIVFAGPGMSHPVYHWNGSVYVQRGEIADDALSSAQIYPQ